jgi:hypothetical protein
MKKITLFLLLAFIGLQFTAQAREETKESKYPQDVDKKNELKLNVLSLIVLSSFDVTYERLLNKDTSFGVSLFYNFNDINDELYFPRSFSLTPYYRWFFTETRFARGFFVEGFGMLNTYKDYSYYDYTYDYNGNYYQDDKIVSATNFALGVSVGGKFIIKSGFVAEVYFGVGRNLFNKTISNFSEDNLVSRGGISLGYRF